MFGHMKACVGHPNASLLPTVNTGDIVVIRSAEVRSRFRISNTSDHAGVVALQTDQYLNYTRLHVWPRHNGQWIALRLGAPDNMDWILTEPVRNDMLDMSPSKSRAAACTSSKYLA